MTDQQLTGQEKQTLPMSFSAIVEKSYHRFLSESTKEGMEKVILTIAIFSYLIHLLVIFINSQGGLNLQEKFFANPIAAIYTPFSFILVYEVYLLLYFLPKSITIYIGKQYEIITLIVIRRIFKDIAYLELESDWFQNQNDLQFTFDAITSLLLFFFIFLFYKNIEKKQYKSIEKVDNRGKNIKRFVQLKKSLATILVPVLVILGGYTFLHWGYVTYQDYHDGIMEFKKINNVFYDEFFTILIVVDVLLLLSSFYYSDKFYKIIRNSGFVISTILIKISFLSKGLINNALILSAVLFGLLVLIIHNLYEKNEQAESLLIKDTSG